MLWVFLDWGAPEPAQNSKRGSIDSLFSMYALGVFRLGGAPEPAQNSKCGSIETQYQCQSDFPHLLCERGIFFLP